MGSNNVLSVLSVGVLSFLTGFYIRGFWLQKNGLRDLKIGQLSRSLEFEQDMDEDLDDEGIDIDSTPLNEIPGEVRMTLVVQQGLKMGKGKAAAQCLHATLGLYRKMTNPESAAYNPEMIRRWEYGNGQAKITLQVPTQEEMDTLFAQAISLGINAYTVIDAGRTQVEPGSATVLGLGPAPKRILDRITGDLKLY